MQTKKSIVESCVDSGDYKRALSICKEWILPISREESSILRRGYECMHYPDFYRQLGYNPEEEVKKAIEILIKIYK